MLGLCGAVCILPHLSGQCFCESGNETEMVVRDAQAKAELQRMDWEMRPSNGGLDGPDAIHAVMADGASDSVGQL